MSEVPASRAWQVVLSSIEEELLSGRLGPGDHLRPERALAAELGVGRSSVREAVRVLDVLGLVRTATGSGPGAGATIVATPSGGMSALMRLQVAAKGFAVGNVVKTRLLLEASVAGDLALLRPVPNLEAALELLDAMDSRELGAAEFLALDAQFHVSLAVAGGNEVIAAMMTGLRDSIESYVLAAAISLPSWEKTSERLRAEHRGIMESIESGDALGAAERVRTHITGYYSESRLPATETAIPAPTAGRASAKKANDDTPVMTDH